MPFCCAFALAGCPGDEDEASAGGAGTSAASDGAGSGGDGAPGGSGGSGAAGSGMAGSGTTPAMELEPAPEPEGPDELCEAPEATELVFAFERTRSIALEGGNSLEFPGMDGFVVDADGVIGFFPSPTEDAAEIARIAKDGSGVIEVLLANAPIGGTGGRVFELGAQLLYDSHAVVYTVPGDGSPALPIYEHDEPLATDGESLYAHQGCSDIAPPDRGIERIGIDGSASALTDTLRCVNHLAADTTHVYWMDKRDLTTAPRNLMRVSNGGRGTPELVAMVGDARGPVVVDDTYVYYQGDRAYSDGQRPVMRVVKSGGTPEQIASPREVNDFLVDPFDGGVYLLDAREAGRNDGEQCVRRLDADGTLTAIVSFFGIGQSLATDDTHVYFVARQPGPVYPLYRAAKPD